MQIIKKLHLFFSIKKFYKTFGEVVGSNFITKLSDMTDDNVVSVIFDINEVLEAAQHFGGNINTDWLTKLERRCLTYFA